MSRLLSATAAVALLLSLSACDPSDDFDPGTSDPTIAELAARTASLSTLASALETAGLDDDLAGAGPFTVFAPNNAAFNAVPDSVLDSLLANPTQLADLLSYHVASGELRAADLSDGQSITTLQGGTLTITVNDDGVFVDGVEVAQANVDASNGVVHVIGSVLTAPLEEDGAGSDS